MIINDHTDELFWSKVDNGDGSGCWEWIGAKAPNGYGNVGINKKTYKAHRVAFFLENGNIPDGTLVLHKCDNPGCVNPSHLFLGTHKDNSHDMFSKGRGLTGTKSPNAVLNERDVIAIRQFNKSGIFNQRELSDMFHVSQGHISDICTKKRWAHL